jgi:hypothetical protein
MTFDLDLLKQMSIGDRIALISLIFTVVTTACVLFLAYAALAQTARPNITVKLLSPALNQCLTDEAHLFVFDVVNIGHWYGSPIAVDVTVFFNFSPEFELREIRYGSTQEHVNTKVKTGKAAMRYLKAEGLKISRHEPGEKVHIMAVTPKAPGDYRLRVSGYSANDASFSQEFEIYCSTT